MLRETLSGFLASPQEEAVKHCCSYFDDKVFSLNDPSKFTGFLEAILVDSISVGVSRKILSHVISCIKQLPSDHSLQFWFILTDLLKLRLMSFEDQITEISHHMAALFEERNDFSKAAQHLSAIPLENSQKNYTKSYITEMYLRIAQLYIAGKDPNQAEIFINRASLLMTASTESSVQVKYKLCYAKVLDFRKKFLEAARRYLELSLQPSLSAEQQTELLRNSILCAIIAPAGLHRSRLLSSLSKDERSQQFDFHAMLRNTQLGHLITERQMKLFEAELEVHQKEKVASGMSILEAAVMEHNLLAISNIYKSIRVDNLAHLLRVPPAQAETVVGRMIAEQRIAGHIDQLDEIVHFEAKTQPWDEHIDVVCSKVNNVVDLLLLHESEFAKERLQRYGC